MLQPSAYSPMKNKHIQVGISSLCAILLAGAFLTACKSPQLAPGGAYTTTTTTNGTTVAVSGDIDLFTADTAFGLAYDTVNMAFNFEANNRAYLWSVSPTVKQTLDKIRPTAVKVRDDFIHARAAYIANPTPSNLTGLELVLAKMQQLVITANAALASATATNSATQ